MVTINKSCLSRDLTNVNILLYWTNFSELNIKKKEVKPTL